MAAPITHIILAHNLSAKTTEQVREQFILGTSFPDIRYLGYVKRESTHLTPRKTPELQSEKNPFRAGMEFHNLLDITREEFWKATGIYASLPQSPFIKQALKFYEDITLYDTLSESEWAYIATYFDAFVGDEFTMGTPKEQVERWHAMLKQYVMEKPGLQTFAHFLQSIDFDSSVISEIQETMEKLQSNSELQERIHELYTYLQRELIHATTR